MVIEMQNCRTCREDRPLTDFWKQPQNKSGHQSECKSCMRGRNNKWQREHHRERHEAKLASIYKRRRLDPIAAWLKGAKHNARVKGLPFTLTAADVVVPEFCPVLGIKLESQMGRGVKRTKATWDAAPSLDRIDNSRGYTPDNVVVVSYRANRIKSDSTPDELRAVADFYDELRNRGRATQAGSEHVAVTNGGKPGCLPEMLPPATEKEGQVSCS